MTQPTNLIDWRTALREQGRTIGWLADQTGRPRRTVYAYSRGTLTPLPEWVADVSRILGVDVIHDPTAGRVMQVPAPGRPAVAS